uniref:Uncharacterized protein n=1 Tax=Eutreptiella gymnastica TaxID=73025 RepID=A0A7S4D3U2_9EUGL|mmetsp:Transcript_78366/g.130774  ORF Transcript_78366/g.130774 Transcript_78366/m.130774 type:complete len:103 (+) Transcript_78366:38-346(+)
MLLGKMWSFQPHTLCQQPHLPGSHGGKQNHHGTERKIIGVGISTHRHYGTPKHGFKWRSPQVHPEGIMTPKKQLEVASAPHMQFQGFMAPQTWFPVTSAPHK